MDDHTVMVCLVWGGAVVLAAYIAVAVQQIHDARQDRRRVALDEAHERARCGSRPLLRSIPAQRGTRPDDTPGDTR